MMGSSAATPVAPSRPCPERWLTTSLAPNASDAPNAAAGLRPLSHVSTNHRMLDLVAPVLAEGGHVLDVGAGEGFFSRAMGDYVGGSQAARADRQLHACDLFPEGYHYADVPCDPIDASGTFPYASARFDAVVSIEVIEHLEDQFSFTRELHRVLKPGGRALVSTPNVSNINSRLRVLHSGLPVLFDPLPLQAHDAVSTAGHIHPIAPYYLAYLFHRAGFTDVRIHVDRRKRSAMLLAGVLAPLWWSGHRLFRHRLRRKAPATYAENRQLLDAANSWAVLTARSVIVEGRKRADQRA